MARNDSTLRYGVTLNKSVHSEEKLKAILPKPWKIHHTTKGKGRAQQVAVCEASFADDASRENNRQALITALGNADFDYLEEKDPD